MGVVYLVHDRVLGRDVAIKFPQPEYVDDSTLHRRFRREARATARLELEGVCPIYDHGEAAGHSYITMRFIDGTGLDRLMKAGRIRDERNILALIRRLALIMDEVHRRGIIHRDLKPANILVEQRTQRPVITDFGCSKIRDDLPNGGGDDTSPLTVPNQPIGTLPYMPMEGFSGAEADVTPQWDIYSLGAIFYELLTGRRPLGDRYHEVIERHVKGPPPAPVAEQRLKQQLPAVDSRTADICLQMLARDPDARPSTMGEVAAAVEDVLRPASTGEAGTEESRLGISRRTAAVGVASLALLLTFGLLRSCGPEQTLPEPQRHFLGVSVSQFQYPGSNDQYRVFPEASRQLETLSQALADRGFQNRGLLQEAAATREAVRERFAALKTETKPGDTIVVALSSEHFLDSGAVYFACHGPTAGPRETAIALSELFEWLGSLSGRNILVVADVAIGTGEAFDSDLIYVRPVRELLSESGPRLCLLAHACILEDLLLEATPPSALQEVSDWLLTGAAGTVSRLLSTINADSGFSPGWLTSPPHGAGDFQLWADTKADRKQD